MDGKAGISGDLLKILVCPETRQPLNSVGESLLADLNRRIAEGQLKNRAGERVDRALEGGLIREDGRWVYPVRQGIPVMLIDEAIPVGTDEE